MKAHPANTRGYTNTGPMLDQGRRPWIKTDPAPAPASCSTLIQHRPSHHVRRACMVNRIMEITRKSLFRNEHERSPPLSLDHYFKIVRSKKLKYFFFKMADVLYLWSSHFAFLELSK